MKNRIVLRLLRAAMPLAVLVGCDGLPTSSTPSTFPASTPHRDLRETGRISGRVVDTLTGEPLANVSIGIPDSQTVTTKPDGTFTLDVEGTGRISFLTEGRGHWRRETHVQVDPAPDIELDILPVDDEFDLVFFDHVFRDQGRSCTHPWREEPRFEIWSTAYTCTKKSAGGACSELEATGVPAPQSFRELIRNVIVSDTPLYTGGKIRGSRMGEYEHPAGTRVKSSEFLQPGRVSVAFVDRGDDSSWAFWQYYLGGEMYAGHIQINARHRTDRGTYSHELAHTLGFDHPAGLEVVPSRSIMRGGHGPEPTPVDILHGRVLYQRPAGSRSPDKDPEDFTLNALALLDGRHDRLKTVAKP
jgi:hypothetical protein